MHEVDGAWRIFDYEHQGFLARIIGQRLWSSTASRAPTLAPAGVGSTGCQQQHGESSENSHGLFSFLDLKRAVCHG